MWFQWPNWWLHHLERMDGDRHSHWSWWPWWPLKLIATKLGSATSPSILSPRNFNVYSVRIYLQLMVWFGISSWYPQIIVPLLNFHKGILGFQTNRPQTNIRPINVAIFNLTTKPHKAPRLCPYHRVAAAALLTAEGATAAPRDAMRSAIQMGFWRQGGPLRSV